MRPYLTSVTFDFVLLPQYLLENIISKQHFGPKTDPKGIDIGALSIEFTSSRRKFTAD